MRALEASSLTIEVIIGPGFTDINRVAIERSISAIDTEVITTTDPDDLPFRLYRSDIAISALGVTVYELLALGVPFVGLLTAPDQRPKAQALEDRDLGPTFATVPELPALRNCIGDLLSNEPRRRELATRGQAVVDGQGTQRVIAGLETIATG
jgi:spore coat polysaccharide biosynthesis predicted glycosyltransferase SpsG